MAHLFLLVLTPVASKQRTQLLQQERSRASMKDCDANRFWGSTQDFFLEELPKEALMCIVANTGEVF